MSTAAAPERTLADMAEPQATLVVALNNLQVRYASPLAVEWLGLPAERLHGRSLLLSQPHLGQALTVAISGGLSPLPTPLSVAMAKPDGARLTAYAHQVDADAILKFQVTDEHDTVGRERLVQSTSKTLAPGFAPDLHTLRQRIDELRHDLNAQRKLIPCDEAMLRGDDPILYWLWQAEGTLGQISKHFASTSIPQRNAAGPSTTPPL